MLNRANMDYHYCTRNWTLSLANCHRLYQTWTDWTRWTTTTVVMLTSPRIMGWLLSARASTCWSRAVAVIASEAVAVAEAVVVGVAGAESVVARATYYTGWRVLWPPVLQRRRQRRRLHRTGYSRWKTCCVGDRSWMRRRQYLACR